MLDAKSLSKWFGAIRAVSDVSFTLAPGEVLGYLGPNGSGKTTTVGMLTGLVEPSGGAVLFHGADIAEDPIEYRRQVGYVPEEPHLYPYLTGVEDLQLVAICGTWTRESAASASRPCWNCSPSSTRRGRRSRRTRKGCGRRS